jgi:hypothetical protein
MARKTTLWLQVPEDGVVRIPAQNLEDLGIAPGTLLDLHPVPEPEQAVVRDLLAERRARHGVEVLATCLSANEDPRLVAIFRADSGEKLDVVTLSQSESKP